MYVWLCHDGEESPRTKVWLANAQLHERHPAWLVGLDGTVLAANELATWLWGLPSGAKDDLRTSVVGLNAFELIAKNHDRIPAEENWSFWLTVLGIEYIVYGEESGPLSSLYDLLPEKLVIYAREKLPDNISQYSLNITDLTSSDGEQLQFSTTVTPVEYEDGTPAGYLVAYAPVGVTHDVVEDIFRRRMSAGPIYVLAANLINESSISILADHSLTDESQTENSESEKDSGYQGYDSSEDGEVSTSGEELVWGSSQSSSSLGISHGGLSDKPKDRVSGGSLVSLSAAIGMLAFFVAEGFGAEGGSLGVFASVTACALVVILVAASASEVHRSRHSTVLRALRSIQSELLTSDGPLSAKSARSEIPDGQAEHGQEGSDR